MAGTIDVSLYVSGHWQFSSAVNQAYVSKFLRGDLFDLSENGRMAICRWYLRYKKIVQCMGKGIRFSLIDVPLIIY